MAAIPGSRHWWKAVWLFLAAYAGGVVIPTFLFWYLLPIGAVLSFVSLTDAGIELWLPGLIVFLLALCLFLGWLWYYALSCLCYAALKIFWSNPPKFLAVSLHWKSVTRNFGTIAISSIPLALVILLRVGGRAYFEVVLEDWSEQPVNLVEKYPLSEWLVKLSWLWFITAVYASQLLQPRRPRKI
jgi:hypothetical protein